jgi:hypothetical protein
MSHTAMTSPNTQREVIGIISVTIGDDMLAADQLRIHQPTTDKATSAAAPFRIPVPIRPLGLVPD